MTFFEKMNKFTNDAAANIKKAVGDIDVEKLKKNINIVVDDAERSISNVINSAEKKHDNVAEEMKSHMIKAQSEINVIAEKAKDFIDSDAKKEIEDIAHQLEKTIGIVLEKIEETVASVDCNASKNDEQDADIESDVFTDQAQSQETNSFSNCRKTSGISDKAKSLDFIATALNKDIQVVKNELQDAGFEVISKDGQEYANIHGIDLNKILKNNSK